MVNTWSWPGSFPAFRKKAWSANLSVEERSMAVKPIPEGYHTVTPYLTVDDPDAVMLFLKDAFGAEETYAMRDDSGRVRHSEIKIGNSMVMLGGAHDEWKARPANFYIYVEDVDAVYKKAIAAGGKSISEPE